MIPSSYHTLEAQMTGTFTVSTDSHGSRFWLEDGRLHRQDGPAIELACGDRFWYQHGQLHRTDGPAIELVTGDLSWWQHGLLHRTDGPAIEEADGVREWWLAGQRLTLEQVHVIKSNLAAKGGWMRLPNLNTG